MNRGTIPIIARLQALQTPAEVTAGGARVIARAGAKKALTALIRELNETILGRALRFEGGEGASLTLEASGRRVLRVTEASGLPGAETCLAADVLEDEQKDDLIKLMQALTVPRQELRVTVSSRSVAGEGVSVGLPVALLADLMLVDLNDASGSDNAEGAEGVEAAAEEPADEIKTTALAEPSLASFVKLLGSTLMAWVIRGGEADGSSDGAEEMVSHLQGFLEDEVEGLQRQLDLVSGQAGSPACMVLGTAMTDGQGVLCARSGGAVLLALFEGNPAQSLLGAWAEARK